MFSVGWFWRKVRLLHQIDRPKIPREQERIKASPVPQVPAVPRNMRWWAVWTIPQLWSTKQKEKPLSSATKVQIWCLLSFGCTFTAQWWVREPAQCYQGAMPPGSSPACWRGWEILEVRTHLQGRSGKPTAPSARQSPSKSETQANSYTGFLQLLISGTF